MKSFDITIAGEINLDLILYGLPQVMPLERELLGTDFQVTLGSSSAILAHNLAVLGSHVGFITLVGSDALGKIALERLGESGADLTRVRVSTGSARTGVTVLLAHGKERHILTYPGTMAEMRVQDLDVAYLKSGRHFHVSSLFLQRALAHGLPALFRELKDAGLTISLDTNDDPEDKWGDLLDPLLDLIDVLLPNEAEACRIAHLDTLDEALEVLSKRVPCIAVKRGAQGSIVRAGRQTFVARGIPVDPIDTIGAGDSFTAGFLFAWLKGQPLDQCALAGNITGALSTLQVGGTEAFRNRDFANNFLDRHALPGRN
jgi:sugar/nucleoside kinase (ribokinase family)